MTTNERFRITTAWCTDEGENPWLLDAYDAWSEDAWDGTPDHFNEALTKAKKDGAEVRLIELFVDYDEIEKHFAAPAVDAEVAPPAPDRAGAGAAGDPHE